MRWGIALSVTILLAFATTSAASAEVRVEKVGDFVQPVYVTGAPGDDRRLYVVERRGTVHVVENGVAKPFLDLRDAVRGPDDPGAGGEEGLLSIAFAPDFQTSRLLYVFFTAPDGNSNRVERLVAPTGDSADPASRQLVISLPHDLGSHHNGGQIQFGPDGMLYIAYGDGGNGGAPARDLGNLYGKLLRIAPNPSGPGYGIPASNPFAGQWGRRPEIWAYGLRNPFRFSFDRATGDLTVGDVGEKTIEEIDYLPFAEGRGYAADFGWNRCEGSFVAGSTARPCDVAGSVFPAIEHTRDEGFRAIVNGYVVRDPSLPSLYGRLVYGDFYVDGLRSALLGPGGASDARPVGPAAQVPRLTSFGEDAGGCVYATSYLGGVYRLVENDTRVPCATTPAVPPSDVEPPALATTSPRSQRVARLKGVVVYARCDEGCRVSARGYVRIGRRGYRLLPVRRAIAAKARARIRLPFRTVGVRALRRALARGMRPVARVTIHAHDSAENWSRAWVRYVRVRR